MRERLNLWRLYNQATGYGKRPSDFFELETDLARWILDEACMLEGRRIENLLNKGEDPFGNSLLKTGGQKYASAPKQLIKKRKLDL